MIHSHAPGYVMANPDDGVTVTHAEGHTLTVAATGGDRIDVRSSRALRLDPGTVPAFATALLGYADYTEHHPGHRRPPRTCRPHPPRRHRHTHRRRHRG